MQVKTKNLVMGSFFLALGLMLPYFFHFIGMSGTIFLPMHIPVLLCGFILGGRYGFIVGLLTPLLNALLTGMPPLYPIAISMALELAAYGFVAGYLYKNKKVQITLSLISAMLLGRAVFGIANYLLLTLGGKKFVLKMFLTSAFVKSIWGIIIQLILVPIIVKAIEKNAERVGIHE